MGANITLSEFTGRRRQRPAKGCRNPGMPNETKRQQGSSSLFFSYLFISLFHPTTAPPHSAVNAGAQMNVLPPTYCFSMCGFSMRDLLGRPPFSVWAARVSSLGDVRYKLL